MQRLAEIGAELLSETLARLHDLTPRPQHDVDATFAPVLEKEDGLIDWSQSAFEIERRIRGFQPWPNAYTSFNSKGLTMWSAEPSATTNASAAPGEIIAVHRDELVVSCGDQTALRLIEVQPESRKRITVREFISGARLKVGDRFG
jgi:methionyl-tRNA formyltransferase